MYENARKGEEIVQEMIVYLKERQYCEEENHKMFLKSSNKVLESVLKVPSIFFRSVALFHIIRSYCLVGQLQEALMSFSQKYTRRSGKLSRFDLCWKKELEFHFRNFCERCPNIKKSIQKLEKEQKNRTLLIP